MIPRTDRRVVALIVVSAAAITLLVLLVSSPATSLIEVGDAPAGGVAARSDGPLVGIEPADDRSGRRRVEVVASSAATASHNDFVTLDSAAAHAVVEPTGAVCFVFEDVEHELSPEVAKLETRVVLRRRLELDAHVAPFSVPMRVGEGATVHAVPAGHYVWSVALGQRGWCEVGDGVTTEVRVTVGRLAAVTGRVIDVSGEPVEGASIAAALTTVGHAYEGLATSAVDGRFTFRWPEEACVVVASLGDQSSAPTMVTDVSDGEQASVGDLVLEPAARLRVIVVDRASGDPESGVEVSVAPMSNDEHVWRTHTPTVQLDSFYSRATGEDGSAYFPNVPAGILRVVARAHGRATFGEKLVFVEVSKETVLRIKIDDELPVVGRVCDERGVAIVAANVRLSDGRPVLSTVESDADGRFALAGVPPAGAEIRADTFGHHDWSGFVGPAQIATGPIEITLERCRRHHVEGVAVLPDDVDPMECRVQVLCRRTATSRWQPADLDPLDASRAFASEVVLARPDVESKSIYRIVVLGPDGNVLLERKLTGLAADGTTRILLSVEAGDAP